MTSRRASAMSSFKNLPTVASASAHLPIRPLQKSEAVSRLQILLSEHLAPLSTTFSEAHQKFTIFPDLPVELRLKLWGHVASQPRNVIIYPPHRDEQSQIPGPRKATLIPSILCTCHEARAEGLKFYEQVYEKILSFNYAKMSYGPSYRRILYVNFNADEFMYDDRLNQFNKDLLSLNPDDLAKIKIFTAHVGLRWGVCRTFLNVRCCLNLAHVDELTLAFNPSDEFPIANIVEEELIMKEDLEEGEVQDVMRCRDWKVPNICRLRYSRDKGSELACYVTDPGL